MRGEGFTASPVGLDWNGGGGRMALGCGRDGGESAAKTLKPATIF